MVNTCAVVTPRLNAKCGNILVRTDKCRMYPNGNVYSERGDYLGYGVIENNICHVVKPHINYLMTWKSLPLIGNCRWNFITDKNSANSASNG